MTSCSLVDGKVISFKDVDINVIASNTEKIKSEKSDIENQI